MTAARLAGTVALVAVAAWALAVQLASDGLYRDVAAPVAFPRAVPAAAGAAVYRALAALPFAPPYVRAGAAEGEIADGRLAAATALVAGLPPGPDRDDLEGALLEARGDRGAAIARYVAAGDRVRVAEAVDRIDRAGDLPLALATQLQLVARLRALGEDDELATAYWRLGQLDAEAGYRDPAARAAAWRRALGDYEDALTLEPLSETYLLGAGNQAFLNGALDAADGYFAQLLAVDPASADGHVGAGRVAAERGDLAAARRELARARSLGADGSDLQALEREIDARAARRRS